VSEVPGVSKHVDEVWY